MQTDQLALRAALTRADHPQVKLILHDGSVERITARAALLRAHSEDYAWAGSSSRVRKIRALKPPPTWQPCHRTQSAAVLPPSIEWLESRETRSKTLCAE